MNTMGRLLGISAPMFVSVVTGLTLLLLTLVLFRHVLAHRSGKWTRTHRVLAWTLLAGLALHAIWGVIAVFILKS